MCFDADARPPLPAIRGGPVDASDLILTSRDGTPVAAVVARAARGGGPGIVVVPDVRGLHPYYEDLTHRFAEAGVHAVALDLYSRTAGTGKRAGDFEYEPHVARLDRTSVDDDIAAAAAVLRSPAGGSADRIFTVGFCIGGRISLLQAAASGVGAEGVIGFYPWPVGSHRSGLPAPP
jgi:carboxymethylenebutenolidase